MKQKKLKTVNLSNAIFKGTSRPKPLHLLISIACFVIIGVLHETGEVSTKALLYVLFPVCLAVLYLVYTVEFFRFWLLPDRIVLKYAFRFRNRFRGILLSDVNYVEYINKTWKGGPRSMVIINPKDKSHRKEYKIYFDDRTNKEVFVFLNILYTRGFEISISSCKREDLVADQIKIGIRNDKKLLSVHY